MGAAGICAMGRFMRFNPKNPAWLNRDRLLSAGHGSMLHALLYLTGYEDLTRRPSNSANGVQNPGHPETL